MLKNHFTVNFPDTAQSAGRDGPRGRNHFSDAHFPAHSLGPQVIRADGLSVSDLLRAIIPLFELDSSLRRW